MQKTKLEEGRSLPVGRGGFVPNSILLRLLWPNPPPVKVPEKPYQPPAIKLQHTDDGSKVFQKFKPSVYIYFNILRYDTISLKVA